MLLTADVGAVSGLDRLFGGGNAAGVASPELAVNLALRGDDMGSLTTAANSWGVRCTSTFCQALCLNRPRYAEGLGRGFGPGSCC